MWPQTACKQSLTSSVIQKRACWSCHLSLFHDAILLLAGRLRRLMAPMRSLQNPFEAHRKLSVDGDWVRVTHIYNIRICGRSVHQHAHSNSPNTESRLSASLADITFLWSAPCFGLGPCLGWAQLWLWLGWNKYCWSEDSGGKKMWRYLEENVTRPETGAF